MLIAGGAGFLGSNFAHFLASQPSTYHIEIYDSFTYAGDLSNLDPLDGLRIWHRDLLDKDSLLEACKGVDVVVNFAAETHNDNSISEPRKFFDTNVQGFLNLLEACLKAGKRLHQVSTDEVFGDMELGSTELFTPESRYRPSSPYSSSKAAGDHMALAWHRTYGLEITLSNSSNAYGPRQHEEKLIPYTINRLRNGHNAMLYGSGNNVRDWIHVDDHSSAILAIVERGSPGTQYLIGCRQERSNVEVVQAVMNAMGVDREIEFIADRPGHDLRYAIDNSLLQNSLGWQPTKKAFEAELPDVVSYYLSRGE